MASFTGLFGLQELYMITMCFRIGCWTVGVNMSTARVLQVAGLNLPLGLKL